MTETCGGGKQERIEGGGHWRLTFPAEPKKAKAKASQRAPRNPNRERSERATSQTLGKGCYTIQLLTSIKTKKTVEMESTTDQNCQDPIYSIESGPRSTGGKKKQKVRTSFQRSSYARRREGKRIKASPRAELHNTSCQRGGRKKSDRGNLKKTTL